MFYQIGPGEGYEWVFPVNPDDHDTLASLDGSKRAQSWKPIEVYRGKADERHPGWPADFPWCSVALIMKQAAVDVLDDLVSCSGEILPLATRDDTPLYVANVPTVAALDEQKSELWRFQDGRVMGIRKAALNPDRIGDREVFRVYPGSPMFVTAKFLHLVQQAKLSGLTFQAAGRDRGK